MSIEITSGFISGCGLALDIIGAFFLAESFLLQKPEETSRFAASYYGGNPFILRSTVIQIIEARTGFLFLLLGFTGQLLADTTMFKSKPTDSWVLILSIGFLIGAVTFILVRKVSNCYANKRMAKQWGVKFKKNLRDYLEKDLTAKEENAVQYWGMAMGLQEKKGESLKEYAIRIISEIERFE